VIPGGMRSEAFLIPNNGFSSRQRLEDPQSYTGLMSGTDWKATLLSAATIEYKPGENAIDKDDSKDLWDAIVMANNSLGSKPIIVRQNGLFHYWKEKPLVGLWFYFDGTLYKYISGIPVKGEGGGYATMSSGYRAFMSVGASRSAIVAPPELPNQELDKKIFADQMVYQGRQSALFCLKAPCIFNLDDDPSELNPRPENYSTLQQFAVDLVNQLGAHYIRAQDSGQCDKGWYPLPHLDLTDLASVKYYQTCGMEAPWLSEPGESQKMGCLALF
jgi:hypothetical protein